MSSGEKKGGERRIDSSSKKRGVSCFPASLSIFLALNLWAPTGLSCYTDSRVGTSQSTKLSLQPRLNMLGGKMQVDHAGPTPSKTIAILVGA